MTRPGAVSPDVRAAVEAGPARLGSGTPAVIAADVCPVIGVRSTGATAVSGFVADPPITARVAELRDHATPATESAVARAVVLLALFGAGRGEGWNDTTHRFTASPDYSRFDESAVFTTTKESGGVRYTRLKITLQPVAGGNAQAVPVDPDAYPT